MRESVRKSKGQNVWDSKEEWKSVGERGKKREESESERNVRERKRE